MRILFCHDGPLKKDEFNNYYGSAHNDEMFSRYYNIAEELVIAIRTRKISTDEANQKFSKITVSPCTVIEIPNISSIKGTLFNKLNVKKKIKEAVTNTDYIVVRLPSLIGYLAFDEAQKQNKPCLVEVVACPWDAFWNYSLKGKIVAPFMYHATKRRVLEAKHVIYVTNEFLQTRYPTNGKNTNCSNVALTKFDDNILEARSKKIDDKTEDGKIIIGTTAAVNVRYKGQQYVIEALAKLKKQGITNYEYQLVGGGDQTYLRSVAKKFNVSDQVVFLGSMQHKEVFRWLETIDIYAQPSKQEGLPRALIEAMSRGLPAIGANTAGIPELLEDEVIFNHSSKRVNDITNILKKFNKEEMINQAKRNYAESKKYEKNLIENRRKEFFKKFANV